MSGRKGITVSADEVIAEAIEQAFLFMQAMTPPPANLEALAPIVGIGALKFTLLKATPERKINFRWDTTLAREGDTAVKVQYAHARARKIARKYIAAGLNGTADFSSLGELELGVLKTVAKYPEVLALCTRDKSAHPMCAYALELATGLNGYYNHRDANGKVDTNILESPEGLREARLAVVTRVADAIKEALAVLGIDAPDEM